MEYTVVINQQRAIEWGLNHSEAILLGFLFDLPLFALLVDYEGKAYYRLTKHEIVDRLPFLTSKPDTAYRILKKVSKKGLVSTVIVENETFVRLTDKGLSYLPSRWGGKR